MIKVVNSLGFPRSQEVLVQAIGAKGGSGWPNITQTYLLRFDPVQAA
jgi:hypothetical protein